MTDDHWLGGAIKVGDMTGMIPITRVIVPLGAGWVGRALGINPTQFTAPGFITAQMERTMEPCHFNKK